MAFKLQRKTTSGTMVDVPIAATTDINGNNIHTHYATINYVDNAVANSGGGGNITIDSVPTDGSTNAVSSNGVYDALQNAIDQANAYTDSVAGSGGGGTASSISGTLTIVVDNGGGSGGGGTVCTFIHAYSGQGTLYRLAVFIPAAVTDETELAAWLTDNGYNTYGNRYAECNGMYSSDEITGISCPNGEVLFFADGVAHSLSELATVEYNQVSFTNSTITAVNMDHIGMAEPGVLTITDLTLYVDGVFTTKDELVSYLTSNTLSTPAVVGYCNDGDLGEQLATHFATNGSGGITVTYASGGTSTDTVGYISAWCTTTFTPIELTSAVATVDEGETDTTEPETREAPYYAGANEAGDALEISAPSIEFKTDDNTVTLDELASKQDELTFDTSPKVGSTNPVTSNGVYTAIDSVRNELLPINSITSGSLNSPTSSAVYNDRPYYALSGRCTTSAATASKTVTCKTLNALTGSLGTGTVIDVYFNRGSTSGTMSLNVNSKGSKTCYFANSTTAPTISAPSSYCTATVRFVYTGSYFVCVPTVIEESRSTSSSNPWWYRKWSDGMIEQGATVTMTAGTTTTVTFPTAFKTMVLSLTTSYLRQGIGGDALTVEASGITALTTSLTSFTIRNTASSDTVCVSYEARGY